MKRFLSAVLAAAVLAAALMTCGCSKPPELEDVRGELEALIGASAEINDIFFGAGLPVYDRGTASGDGSATFDESSGLYYWIFDDPAAGKIIKYYSTDSREYVYGLFDGKTSEGGTPGLYVGADGSGSFTGADGKSETFGPLTDYKEPEKEYVYDENSPLYYDYVREDCKYQTVNEIKEAAEKVYSAEYLASVYSIIFDGYMSDDSLIYARYMADDSSDSDLLLESNQFKPYFETQTSYDLSTMKIVRPSRADFINVEIEAEGVYIDYEALEKKTGRFVKTLKFVKEKAGWRLDTPTY
ncbi:MAG: hypothetical protein IJU46_05305 [Clostridia bacterium]|nr:hypothetical protein [Clostridia bacterium]